MATPGGVSGGDGRPAMRDPVAAHPADTISTAMDGEIRELALPEPAGPAIGAPGLADRSFPWKGSST